MEMLIVMAVGVLLVRVGQTLYAVGLARSKNSAGAAARSLVDFCLAVLAFWAVGAAILFQHRNGWLAVRPDLLFGWELSTRSAATVFFYATSVAVASGVLVGTLSERSRFGPAAVGAILLAGVTVPIAGKWAWSGWLGRLGFIDLAGASAIHLAAGVCAAVGAVLVGARTGKYNRDGSASMIPGHNVPLAAAGALIMLPGLVACAAGFASVQGVPMGRVCLNVLLAASSGAVAAVALSRLRYGKIDITLAMLGLLGGLVAITAGAAHVSTASAVVIGAVAGVIVPLASIALDLLARIDDPTGGIAVHLVGGLWGILAAGLFAPAPLALRFKHVGVQLLGAVAVATLAAVLSGLVFAAFKRLVGLRAKEADEFDGLDLAEHDIAAYPDFQQTMIKSYHLREA